MNPIKYFYWIPNIINNYLKANITPHDRWNDNIYMVIKEIKINCIQN